DMTSQRWRTPAEVSQPEWRHWLTVVRPAEVRSDASLPFITGGANDGEGLPKLDPMLASIAAQTGTIVTESRMVPNQPPAFDDGWPARLPMTKAAVRAMDTVQAYAQTEAGGRRAITRFVVSGGSKRGWTTWTTAAVDSRVVAIVPLVIDMLNLEPSFVHHYRA